MSDQVVSDELLMQAAGKGDLEAFGEIVRRNQTWIWKVAYRFLGDKEDAADIVQDTLIRLLDASNRYHPTASFKTYLYKVVTRLCLDQAKKKQPLYLETIPDSPDPRPDAAEKIMQQETVVAVRIALDALPPNQRMAIVLRYFENLNYEEIASALETTQKAVERLLSRGRERLRDTLSEHGKIIRS